MLTNRRNEEAALIRNANVACAMGRLLLGELNDWHEFLAPDFVDYAALPRRQLKSGKQDIQKDLADRIEGFCAKNFDRMNGKSLVRLYDLVKAKRGIEISYSEFKEKFSPVKNFAKLGYPKHSTICITLWGMQYRFPERDFTNDLLVSLDQLALANQHLAEFNGLPHAEVILRREDLKEHLRSSDSAKRQIMQASFSLIECYLNGIAWNFCQEHDLTKISKTQADLLREDTIKDTRLLAESRPDQSLRMASRRNDFSRPWSDSSQTISRCPRGARLPRHARLDEDQFAPRRHAPERRLLSGDAGD